MTSFRQFEANRRNALRSTGPKTAEGKGQSRCNALRHGLSAETVIDGLENSEDYRAFEAAVQMTPKERARAGAASASIARKKFSTDANVKAFADSLMRV